MHISEVLKLVGAVKDAKDKAIQLKKYESAQLKLYLYFSLCNAVEFAIPETPAEYTPFDVPVEQGETNLFHEARKMKYFLKGGVPNLQQAKREKLYVDMLNRLSRDEAAAMEDIRLGLLESKYGISRSVVERAFADVAAWFAKYSKAEVVQPVAEKVKSARPKAAPKIKKLDDVINEVKATNEN